MQNKKGPITGGDFGVERAIAILYAMGGADSIIVYLPEEEGGSRDEAPRGKGWLKLSFDEY